MNELLPSVAVKDMVPVPSTFAAYVSVCGVAMKPNSRGLQANAKKRSKKCNNIIRTNYATLPTVLYGNELAMIGAPDAPFVELTNVICDGNVAVIVISADGSAPVFSYWIAKALKIRHQS